MAIRIRDLVGAVQPDNTVVVRDLAQPHLGQDLAPPHARCIDHLGGDDFTTEPSSSRALYTLPNVPLPMSEPKSMLHLLTRTVCSGSLNGAIAMGHSAVMVVTHPGQRSLALLQR